MDNWVIAGVIMTALFFLIGFMFLIMKEKGASLISGYNFKSKEERQKYDEKQMSKNMRNLFFICSLIFLVGTVATYIWSNIFFWIAFLISSIYFLKSVHFNDKKAYEKYKKENRYR